MAVDLKNHPGANPAYEKGMKARRRAQESNRRAELYIVPVPKQPNKYVPHIGAKQRAGGSHGRGGTMTELSTDARCLISGWFSMGDRTTVKVGGKGAQSILTPRGQAAIDELVAAGFVEAEVYNDFGRMLYRGTDKCRGAGLSLAEMKKHGGWSPTGPNPEYRP